jgi:HTH-type transcriptional regulator/antitoxin HigA
MKSLKYTIIKSREQYDKYCNILEELVCNDDKNSLDEVELLSLLIEKWDTENNTLKDLDPIRLLKSLMKENNLKSKDLVEVLGLSKGTVSKILNYHKGLSKETIRKLADYFKVSQEAFNRPYKLVNEMNRHFRNASLMNTKKSMENIISP